jgi:FixJ family two-component response regulator
LDLNFPDSAGLDTLSRFRQISGNVPVEVFTGIEDEAMDEQATREGADDYLTNDCVDEAMLVRAIRDAKDRREARTQLRH